MTGDSQFGCMIEDYCDLHHGHQGVCRYVGRPIGALARHQALRAQARPTQATHREVLLFGLVLGWGAGMLVGFMAGWVMG